VARHATLRTRFAWDGDALVATPTPPEAIALPVDDVADLDRWLATHVTARLDPTDGPIWRARLARRMKGLTHQVLQPP
jgi:hypothetical protein